MYVSKYDATSWYCVLLVDWYEAVLCVRISQANVPSSVTISNKQLFFVHTVILVVVGKLV